MNVLWTSIFIISTGLMLVGSVDSIIPALIVGGSKAVTLSIKLLAIYGVWCGLARIMEDTGVSNILTKLCNPIVSLLFGKNVSRDTRRYVSVNLACNFLGLGNASTPSGIAAITSMPNKGGVASNNMLLLLILNVCYIQLFPTTIIGLLSSSGSSDPFRVVLPTFIVSLLCSIVGIIVVKICSKFFRGE